VYDLENPGVLWPRSKTHWSTPKSGTAIQYPSFNYQASCSWLWLCTI